MQKFVESIPATAAEVSVVLIDAVHATGPGADEFTGEIVREVAKNTGCHAIVGLVSRTVADLNRPSNQTNREANHEYRETIKELLTKTEVFKDGVLTSHVLHLAIHGMKDCHKLDVEVGTRCDSTCSPEVTKFVMKKLEDWAVSNNDLSDSLRVGLNENFSGDKSKVFHRKGDPNSNYDGYGDQFHTLQIEWSRSLREHHRAEVVMCLSSIVSEFPAFSKTLDGY